MGRFCEIQATHKVLRAAHSLIIAILLPLWATHAQAAHDHSKSSATHPKTTPEKPTETPLSLNVVLDSVSKNNPELEAIYQQATASKLEADTEFYLPAPMLSIGSMGMNGPFAHSGHMQNSYQITQEIPFPLKTYEKRSALRQQAQAEQAMAEAKLLTLRSNARKAYLEYWKVREEQKLLSEKFEAVSAHTKRLKYGALSNQLMQAHLISADNDLTLIQNEIETAGQMEVSARAQLNALMGLDPFAPLAAPVEIPLSQLPPAPTPDKISELVERHPELREMRAKAASAMATRKASQSLYLPDFTLSYRRNYNTQNSADASNSEVMIGISLPFLFFWQPNAVSQSSRAKFSKTEAEVKVRQTGLRLDFIKQYAELSSLRTQYLRYQNSVLASAERRLRISHGIGTTDMESADEHRGAAESLADLRMKSLELRVEFEKGLSDYESLLGTEKSL